MHRGGSSPTKGGGYSVDHMHRQLVCGSSPNLGFQINVEEHNYAHSAHYFYICHTGLALGQGKLAF